MNNEHGTEVAAAAAVSEQRDASCHGSVKRNLPAATAANKRRRCVVDSCEHAAVSNGRCRGHGGGRRCAMGGCTRAAQSGDPDYRCYAHGGGHRRCSASGCIKRIQSRGLCIAHGGRLRCGAVGCKNWAQKRGLCFRHCGQQELGAVRQPISGMNASDHGASVRVGLTSEEHENTAREVLGADAALSDTTSTVVRCPIEGCTAVAEKKGKKGLCRFHGVNQRCNYVGGCRNVAHLNNLFCLTHLAHGGSPPRRNSNTSSTVVIDPAVVERNARVRASTVKITARQQELQARQYCDSVLLARSAELFAILGGDAAAETFDTATLSSRPAVQTTARAQQKIAERFCNEVLAARAYHFMRTTPASRPTGPTVTRMPATGRRHLRNPNQVEECNIRGCRNLANGRRPLCAAHEAWATGQYPAPLTTETAPQVAVAPIAAAAYAPIGENFSLAK